MDQLLTAATESTPIVLDVLKALVFLVIGWWLSGRIGAVVRKRVLASDNLDDTLGTFFASIARYFILIVTVIAVLQVFGFQATSLVAVLGAATLAIGLALQGTLSHVASGVMLIMFRPYKIGDYVEIAGRSGTVKAITLFTTELATPDNIHIIVPNGNAWGNTVVNYSTHPTRRVDLVFGISYDDDPEAAITVMKGLVDADDRILKDPEPFFAVTALGESAVDVTMRVWVNRADHWATKIDLIKNVKSGFDEKGISFPYPHMQVVGVPGGSA